MMRNDGIADDSPAGHYRLIDRRLVHKRANAEVFITGVRETDASWLCWAQISRGHSRVVGEGGRVPLVLDFEVIRQAAIAVAHLGYAVPLEEAFIIDEVFVHRIDAEYGAAPIFHPLELTLQVRQRSVVLRHGRIATLELEIDFRDPSGALLAVGGGQFRCLTPSQYRAVRRNAPAVPPVPLASLAPTAVNVCIGASGLTAELGVNYDDGFIFDHATDHLPGLIFVDGAIELFRARYPSMTVTSLQLTSLAFTELGQPVAIVATADSSGLMRMEFHQGSSVVALCTVSGAAASVKSDGAPVAGEALSSLLARAQPPLLAPTA